MEEVIRDFQQDNLKKVYNYLNQEPLDVSLIGPARRDILDRDLYFHKGVQMVDLFHASRGCKFSCYPCAVSYLGGRVFRPRPIDKSIEELETIENNRLFIVDNSLAQDTHWEESGPFTGEVSPLVLRELGCTFIEIGHAERRAMFGETDERVRRKVRAVLKQGLVPLICVGEHTEQRTDLAIDNTLQQMRKALGDSSNGGNAAESGAVVIAYEPVWAIGVDRSAPVDHIEPVVSAIREELSTLWSGASAVLYGGSVNPHQAKGLLKTGVDGLFIGRAALDIDKFFEIIFAVANSEN